MAPASDSDQTAHIPTKPRMDLPKTARALNAQILDFEERAGDSTDLIRELRFAVVNAVSTLENDMTILAGRPH